MGRLAMSMTSRIRMMPTLTMMKRREESPGSERGTGSEESELWRLVSSRTENTVLVRSQSGLITGGGGSGDTRDARTWRRERLERIASLADLDMRTMMNLPILVQVLPMDKPILHQYLVILKV